VKKLIRAIDMQLRCNISLKCWELGVASALIIKNWSCGYTVAEEQYFNTKLRIFSAEVLLQVAEMPLQTDKKKYTRTHFCLLQLEMYRNNVGNIVSKLTGNTLWLCVVKSEITWNFLLTDTGKCRKLRISGSVNKRKFFQSLFCPAANLYFIWEQIVAT
jgi:hypothetical protein